MITITHTCGHTQDTNIDRYTDERIQEVLHKTKEQFIHEQKDFLERNLCPTCYCNAKDQNPNLKPS